MLCLKLIKKTLQALFLEFAFLSFTGLIKVEGTEEMIKKMKKTKTRLPKSILKLMNFANSDTIFDRISIENVLNISNPAHMIVT